MAGGHASHEWGPHEGGIRWVQCSKCKALRHEEAAKVECDPSGAVVRAEREERERKMAAGLRRVARAEAGGLPPAPAASYGLWQFHDGKRRR